VTAAGVSHPAVKSSSSRGANAGSGAGAGAGGAGLGAAGWPYVRATETAVSNRERGDKRGQERTRVKKCTKGIPCALVKLTE
jgi:hypothetical protein